MSLLKIFYGSPAVTMAPVCTGITPYLQLKIAFLIQAIRSCLLFEYESDINHNCLASIIAII